MERALLLPPKTKAADYQTYIDQGEELLGYYVHGLISAGELYHLNKILNLEFVNRIFNRDKYTFNSVEKMGTFLRKIGLPESGIRKTEMHEKEHFDKAVGLGRHPLAEVWLLTDGKYLAFAGLVLVPDQKPEDIYTISNTSSHLKEHREAKLSQIQGQVSPD